METNIQENCTTSHSNIRAWKLTLNNTVQQHDTSGHGDEQSTVSCSNTATSEHGAVKQHQGMETNTQNNTAAILVYKDQH